MNLWSEEQSGWRARTHTKQCACSVQTAYQTDRIKDFEWNNKAVKITQIVD